MKNVILNTAIMLLVTISFVSAKDMTYLEKGLQYEKAAINYITASNAQQELAEEMISVASEYKKMEYLYEEDRRKNFYNAAIQDRKAGDKYYSSAINLDKAIQCWKKAAFQYKHAGNREKSDECLQNARNLSFKVKKLLKDTILAYEDSVNGYSIAGKLSEVASMSIRAAGVRMNLAGRD